MTNFRLVQDANDQSHVLLVCDVTYDDELGSPPFGGFSFSALHFLRSNSSEPEFGIYLPFPSYNDASLADALLTCDVKLAFGKWIKKAADPTLIAMIVLLVQPIWTTVYKKLLEEKLVRTLDLTKERWPAFKELLAGKIARFIECVKDRWPEGLPVNFSVDIPLELYSPWPSAILLPGKAGALDSLSTVGDGIEIARAFCVSDFTTWGKRIRRLKLSYDGKRYAVIGVEYADGTHKKVE
jgi:hypothetical protein